MSGRLRGHFRKERGFTSDQAIADSLDVSRQVVTKWHAGKKASLPSAENLIVLAQRERLNPGWVLLGEGPKLRGTSVPGGDLGNELRAHLASKLAAQLGANPAFLSAILPSPEELLAEVAAHYRPRGSEAVMKGRARSQKGSLPWSEADLQRALDAYLAAEDAHWAALPPVEPEGSQPGKR